MWRGSPKAASRLRWRSAPSPGTGASRSQSGRSALAAVTVEQDNALRRPAGRSGLADRVSDRHRAVGFHHQRVGDALEHAEHEHHAVALLRKLEAFLASLAAIFGGAAVAEQRQNVTALEAVALADVERHHV